MTSATPEQIFSELVVERGGQPFVTYYDEASGERSELSARSLGNWVAKTHFLLMDELGLGPGDRAYVALPAHWISVAAVLGCLTAGVELRTDPAGADVAFVAPDRVPDGVPDVFAIAPESAAVGFRERPPDGTQDYVLAVRPQADKWATVQLRATAGDRCLDGATRAQVVAAARANGLPDGARVLSTRQWATGQDLIDALLAPLVARGSIVLVRNADPALVDRRADQERASVRLDG